jgi:photosystem II stability/assembly factor-like uncharacterized protein
MSFEFSSNGGRSWQSLGKPRPASDNLMCTSVAEMDGVVFTSLLRTNKMVGVADTIAAVYRTTNGGASWERLITPNLSDTDAVASWLYVHLFRDGAGKRILFVDNQYHLWRSTDDGVNWWEDTASSIHGGWKKLVQVNGSLFMCAQGWYRIFYDSEGNPTTVGDSAGVYRSDDYGLSWVNVSGDLNQSVTSGFAAVASTQDPSRVFLATTTKGDFSRANVLTSTEGGKRWRPFTGDLRVDFSTGFGFASSAVAGDDRYLYFCARRRPWSEAELTSVNPVHEYRPTAFSLSQNYPNPFNPATTIGYALPRRSRVTLLVFNLLGQNVATLVEGEVEAGYHETVFDASRLASGVYFYRLQAGDFVETKRLMVLK